MRRRGSGLAGTAVLCTLLLAVGSPPAVGTTDPTDPTGHGPSSTSDLIAQVQADLAESSAAMIRAATDLRLAESALPGARSALSRTTTLLAAAQHRQEVAAQRRGQSQSELVLAARQAEVVGDAVADQHARVGRLARAVYQSGGPVGDAAMLLQASSPADFAERLVSLQAVASSQRSALADLRVAEQSSGDRAERLDGLRSRMAAADRAAQMELTLVTGLQRRAQAATATVARLVDRRQAAIDAASAAAAQDERQALARQATGSSLQSSLDAEAHRLPGDGAGRPHVAGVDVPAVPGTLTRPVDGPITSPFGMRVHPITGVRKLHTGTDFGVPCGTPIAAALAGTVRSTGYDPAYGNRTVVSHGQLDGARLTTMLTTTYNHQSDIGVTVGQHVGAGEVIGRSGTTGYSTGCHLHLELLVNADFVDPLPWLVR